MKLNLEAINTKELFKDQKFTNYLYQNFSYETYNGENCQTIVYFYIGDSRYNGVVFAEINKTLKETGIRTGNIIHHTKNKKIDKDITYKFFRNVDSRVRGFIEEE